VTPAEALALLKGLAGAGRYRVIGHARKRMGERGVTFRDLRHSLVNAASCTAQENDRWRVATADLDGDALTVVVVFEDDVVVITLY
jgi:hypothetical protein